MIQYLVSFVKSVWYWLGDCWRARPCQVKCAVCGRALWKWGDESSGPFICSDACEYEFVTSMNLEEIPF